MDMAPDTVSSPEIPGNTGTPSSPEIPSRPDIPGDTATAGSPATARTVTVVRYGEPADALELAFGPIPEPGPTEVVVAVRAAGVNPYDLKLTRGVMGTDPDRLPMSLGGEAAGVVHSAGADSGFAAGDEVVVYPARGAFADYVLADAAVVHRKPEGLAFTQAAALLLAGVTAVDTLETLRVSSGDVLLVHGAAGAVGSIVVTRARERGATVIGTASPHNHDYVRGLGAIPVAYGDGLLDAVRGATESPVTGVIDTAGTDEAIDVSLQLVPANLIVSIAAWQRGSDGIVLVGGTTEESRRHRREAIAPLLDDAAAGKLVVEIIGTFPLTATADALATLAGPHPPGKVVVLP